MGTNMRIVIQKVKEAKVLVAGEEISSIGKGLLLLVGVGKGDSYEDISYLANKIKNLRIFEDDNEKMDLNIKQIKGQILSVPQFTLYADTHKGNRPGFDKAAGPKIAEENWIKFNNLLRNDAIQVREGQFASKMQVQLINDGPVTIWLDSKER